MRIACAMRGLELASLRHLVQASSREPCAAAFAAACVLLSSVLATHVVAQGTQPFATKSGLQFSVPTSLRPVVVPAELGSSAQVHVIEQMFSDGAATPLQLFVVSSPAHPEHILPPNTDEVRRDFANGFIAGARPVLKKFELHGVTPGNYDPARGAFLLELDASGPARAHTMLGEPDDGPVWADVRKSGEDAKLLRCFITQLLGGANFADETRLRANSSAAAERCEVPLARIERFLANVDRAAFGPTAIALSSVAILTRFATVSFYVFGPAERKQDIDALATLLWSTASVAPEARLESAADDLSSPLESGRMIGVVLGAFVAILTLGGALAWPLAQWLRLSPTFAVAIAFLALNAWMISSVAQSQDAVSLQRWMQLGGYLFASVVLFRPMTKWFAARGPEPTPARGGP